LFEKKKVKKNVKRDYRCAFKLEESKTDMAFTQHKHDNHSLQMAARLTALLIFWLKN